MNARRAGLIAVVSLGLYGLYLIGMAHTATSPAPDFPNYYYSAIAEAEGESIYSDFTDRLEADRSASIPNINYLADPPPVVLLFYPVRWISYELAFWILIAVSGIAMTATVWATGVELGMARPWVISLAAASLLTTGFRFMTLRNHFEAVLALLAALGWVRLRRRGSPGAYWGIAAGLKLFPALWTVGLVRNRRAVVDGLAAFVAIVGLTAVMIGPQDFSVYVREVIPRASQWFQATGNYSLMSVGTLIGGTPLGWGLTGVGFLGFGWTAYRLGNDHDALYVAGVAWSLLLSPLSWLNYLVIVISPLMVAARNINWSKRNELYPAAFMLVGLLAMRPIVSFESTWINIVLSRIPTMSLLVLAIWAPGLMVKRAKALGA